MFTSLCSWEDNTTLHSAVISIKWLSTRDIPQTQLWCFTKIQMPGPHPRRLWFSWFVVGLCFFGSLSESSHILEQCYSKGCLTPDKELMPECVSLHHFLHQESLAVKKKKSPEWDDRPSDAADLTSGTSSLSHCGLITYRVSPGH